jgi:solute carrier family 35 protein E1
MTVASLEQGTQQLQKTETEHSHLSKNAHFSNGAVTVWEMVQIVSLIVAWYMSSSFSNNINKSILDDSFAFPLTLTMLNFGFVWIFCAMMFAGTKNFVFHKLDTSEITSIILPLCMSQIVAHLLTQVSLQHVPVSFTHTIKVVPLNLT